MRRLLLILMWVGFWALMAYTAWLLYALLIAGG